MRRIVVEPEAAPADADEPDPSVPLKEASGVRHAKARTF
jgi:hypothetical protein